MRNRSMMSGAEFQCAREYLGLPVQWVADSLEVDRRTVYRWERGTFVIPQSAADMMSEWLYRTSLAVGKVTVEVLRHKDTPLLATSDEFDFMAAEGFPASWQRMLCSRVAERTGRGIVWMPLEDASSAIVSMAVNEAKLL